MRGPEAMALMGWATRGAVELIQLCSSANKLFLEVMTALLVHANPDIDPLSVRPPEWITDTKHDQFGSIKSWKLAKCNLVVLPEEFGQLSVLELLDLSHNKLEVLPGSFGGMNLGGTLLLNHNQLTELPASFPDCVRSFEEVCLQNNQLKCLPETFGNIRVTGGMDLSSNALESLPESFGEVQVGGALRLNQNQLKQLPDSFTNTQVTARACLIL